MGEVGGEDGYVDLLSFLELARTLNLGLEAHI